MGFELAVGVGVGEAIGVAVGVGVGLVIGVGVGVGDAIGVLVGVGLFYFPVHFLSSSFNSRISLFNTNSSDCRAVLRIPAYFRSNANCRILN